MTKQELSKHFKALYDFEAAIAKHVDTVIYDDSASVAIYNNTTAAENAIHQCICTLNNLGFTG